MARTSIGGAGEAMRTDSQVYAGALALGIVASMRTMSAPALISQAANKGQLAIKGSKLEFLNGAGAAATTALVAAGELIAHKLPLARDRAQTSSLAARAISGALSGAVLCAARKRSPWLGASFGALGAIGAAHAGQYIQQSVREKLHVSDSVMAWAEQGIVTATALLVTSRTEEEAA
jgi:uncharacterized membrane protein